MYDDVVPATPESMVLVGRDDDGRPEVLILEDHHQPGILEAALRCEMMAMRTAEREGEGAAGAAVQRAHPSQHAAAHAA